MKNTCVSLCCPFIGLCKQYNFDLDRGDSCRYQDDILAAAEIVKDQRRLKAENAKERARQAAKKAKKERKEQKSE